MKPVNPDVEEEAESDPDHSSLVPTCLTRPVSRATCDHNIPSRAPPPPRLAPPPVISLTLISASCFYFQTLPFIFIFYSARGRTRGNPYLEQALEKKRDATRGFHQSRARGATSIQMSCPYLAECPPPPGPRGSPGSSQASDPGRRSSPPGQRSHKEPGREGMRFLAAQSPCSPGSRSLPRSVPPSCLLIISFYSFLKQWLVFLSHFSFLHNPRLLASL